VTVQEAKNILEKKWWMSNSPTFPHQDYEILIGDLIRETDETDYFPNSYIISAKIKRKNKLDSILTESDDEEEFEEFAVSKVNGNCQYAIKFH